MAFCKFCQSELNDETTICPACGKDNADPVQETQSECAAAEEAVDAAPSAAVNEAPCAQEAAEGCTEEACDTESCTEEACCESCCCEETCDEATCEDAAEAADAAAGEAAPVNEKKGTPKSRIIAIVLAIIAVIAVVIFFVTRSKGNEIDSRASYSLPVDQLTPDSAKMQNVVAKLDTHELTNGQFQIYYWMQFYNLANTYGQYLSYLGLDTTIPFDNQDSGAPVDENTTTTNGSGSEEPATLTWEQYFIRSAISCYKEYTALADAATAAGMTLSEEYQSYLDNLEEDLATQAESAELDSAEAFVQASFGTGVTVEDYRAYMETYLMAATYASEMQNVTDYTAEDIEAYYDENASDYETNGVLKSDQNTINVRHILVKPEVDEDTDDDGTADASSDAAWDAAKEKADELYATWQKDPTEDNFSTMATDNSEDTGSTSTGGLYENVYPGQMVTDFNDWCFDEARQPGDTGIVKTTYGYHIMYFVSEGEHPYWYITAESDYKNSIYTERLSAVVDPVSISVNYKNIFVNSVTDMTSE